MSQNAVFQSPGLEKWRMVLPVAVAVLVRKPPINVLHDLMWNDRNRDEM
jgi:hypothetical protein